jgi:hypothetical protein
MELPKDQEIEVTSAMLGAGFAVLERSGIADDYLEGDKLLLADIYRAMQRELVSSQKKRDVTISVSETQSCIHG